MKYVQYNNPVQRRVVTTTVSTQRMSRAKSRTGGRDLDRHSHYYDQKRTLVGISSAHTLGSLGILRRTGFPLIRFSPSCPRMNVFPKQSSSIGLA